MSNLIRINNKLMTKNNKLLTANSGSSGLAYNNNLLKFNNYVIGSGSTPVPPGPPVPAGYDSYVIHLTWGAADQFYIAGLHIDGIQPSASDVTLQYYYIDRWNTATSSEVETAILWQDYYQGQQFFCEAIDITFNSANIPSTVQIKTATWYAGGSMRVTMHVAGVKDGVETDLGSTSATNAPDIIYTVNIN